MKIPEEPKTYHRVSGSHTFIDVTTPVHLADSPDGFPCNNLKGMITSNMECHDSGDLKIKVDLLGVRYTIWITRDELLPLLKDIRKMFKKTEERRARLKANR